jgi:DNA mismatch repair ATPase MutS
MNSIAGFKFNHPGYVFPEFSDETAIDAKELGHPLIPEKERVNNAFDISGEKKIVIITGANMAGKSTFLRTVGVNLVLAGAGSVVCAGEFVCKPKRIMTSMRAFDSLYKHESYFFSELKRLKYIVDELNRGEDVFFILDEILKGTNSHDKTKGSIALTGRLLSLSATGIIATHDLELGKLSDKHKGEIVNKCFDVEFDNGKLKFDYILRDGITTSHNATYLMKNMGLI